MHAIVRTVFSRLHELDSAKEEEKVATNAPDSEETGVKMSVSTELTPSLSHGSSETTTAVEEGQDGSKPEIHSVPPTPQDGARAICECS